ncbi:MAG: VWA domain-containing protein [Eubacteriales bacterium]
MKKLVIGFLICILILSTVACAARKSESEVEYEVSEGQYETVDETDYSVDGPAPAEEEPYFAGSDVQTAKGEETSAFYEDANNEEYGSFQESTFLNPEDHPYSTFSIDVDTASYSNTRRILLDGYLPNVDAVRVEEFINYFDYDYDLPKGNDPIALGATFAVCPWNPDHTLARITVQAEDDLESTHLDSNFVFLLDVSGSMNSEDKLPLVKQAMLMLSSNLKRSDRVSIVVYAGSSGVALRGCPGNDTSTINETLGRLSAGGSTAGGEGIQLAYALAEDYFIEGGNNRVILCTDGDFNVGVSSEKGLERLIEEKRDSGIYLSVLGFGTGNIKDNKMETLADKGNGNYAYIDTILEAQKVLVYDMSQTLYTVAKDVKIQVEFNPDAVSSYRLVGYDNRRLNDEDFNDDTKDAGEMGSGHTVTVFYELELVGGASSAGDIDDLVFQDNDASGSTHINDLPKDWLYVKARYKFPDEDTSQRITLMAGKSDYTSNPDQDFEFASAVAEFALLLKYSDYAFDASYDAVLERAISAQGDDEYGYRAEFIRLVELAQRYVDYDY